MSYSESELELLLEHRLAEALDSGYPPQNVASWMRRARANELANERARPGWIRRAARPLVKVDGKTVTHWRCVRGTHAIDWIYDPRGTDNPPPLSYCYSLDVARAEYDRARGKIVLRG